MQVEEQVEKAGQTTQTIGAKSLLAPLVELLNEAQLPDQLANQISQRLERLEHQISAQSQLIDQLRVESLTDTLTGLPNRRAYDEKLNAEWARAMRTQQSIALISIDVDHFKQYNDSYGHDDGDLCLKQVADTLRQTVQRSADLACRIGGEEFMVVVPGATVKDAVALANKIRLHLQAKRLSHKQNWEGQGVVTVSVGVAQTIPTPERTPEDLYKAVDQALYQAKQSGRNQVSAQVTTQTVAKIAANLNSLKCQQAGIKARLAQAALQAALRQSRIISAKPKASRSMVRLSLVGADW
jgi:diguanylate cyclase (GGDEF)-like protein